MIQRLQQAHKIYLLQDFVASSPGQSHCSAGRHPNGETDRVMANKSEAVGDSNRYVYKDNIKMTWHGI